MFLFRRKKRGVNKVLLVLLITNGLILVAGAMLGPIYALFVEDIGGSLLDASYAGMVYAIVAGVVVMIAGKYSDRLKRPEYVIAAGYAVVAAGFFYYLYVDSIFELLIAQAAIGFGEAIYSPAYDAVYSNNLDKHQEATQWGIWEAMSYFVAAAGALIGGYLVTWYGFNALFVTMGVICLVSYAAMMLLPKKFFR